MSKSNIISERVATVYDSRGCEVGTICMLTTVFTKKGQAPCTSLLPRYQFDVWSDAAASAALAAYFDGLNSGDIVSIRAKLRAAGFQVGA